MKYTVIPMPLNKDGKGPETDPNKVVKTVYQIWDEANCTISEHGDLINAEVRCAELNIPHPGVEGPEINDLSEVPKIGKHQVREAKKMALEREVRRKKYFRSSKAKKERDQAVSEYNSLSAQKQRRQLNKIQQQETPCTSSSETLTTPSPKSVEGSEMECSNPNQATHTPTAQGLPSDPPATETSS